MLYSRPFEATADWKLRTECCYKVPIPEMRTEWHSVKGVSFKVLPTRNGQSTGLTMIPIRTPEFFNRS